MGEKRTVSARAMTRKLKIFHANCAYYHTRYVMRLTIVDRIYSSRKRPGMVSRVSMDIPSMLLRELPFSFRGDQYHSKSMLSSTICAHMRVSYNLLPGEILYTSRRGYPLFSIPICAWFAKFTKASSGSHHYFVSPCIRRRT